MINTGRVLSTVTSFNDGNINPTYKGNILFDNKIASCYFKLLPYFEIAIEYICSSIARQLRLPVPDPIIVIMDHEAIPDIPVGHTKIGFGSIDLEYPSFKRRFPQFGPYLRMLVGFPEITEVSAFDEWIVNTDRNLGNILYDGGEQVFFIDHGLALRSIADFKLVSPRNIIVEIEKEVLKRDELSQKYYYIEQGFIPKIVESIVNDSVCNDFAEMGLLTIEQTAFVRDYLKNRIPYMIPILMQVYEMSQLELHYD